MKKVLTILPLFLPLIFAFPYPMSAQIIPDPGILTEISKISAIDNHAHPLRVVNEGETDTEWGSLSYHGSEPSGEEPAPIVFRLRPPTPEYIRAWRALYGYTNNDMAREHVQELIEMKRRIKREQGDNYPTWVLDRLGIETMLTNRVAMGRGLEGRRFRWVSYADALMFPLNNEEAKKGKPGNRISYLSLERVLNRYLLATNTKRCRIIYSGTSLGRLAV